MSDEKLQLTLWHMPDGRSMVGDQHGREIENVTSLNISRSLSGPVDTRVVVEAANCDVREFDAVQRRAISPTKPIKVEVDGKPVELRELGNNQRVIVLKWDDVDSEVIDHFRKSAQSVFGEGTVVVHLPKDAEMEIIELPRREEKPVGNLQRRKADWAF